MSQNKTNAATQTNAAHLYIVNLFATQRNAIHLYIDKYSIPQHQIDLQLPIAKEKKTSKMKERRWNLILFMGQH